jgi:hypothetical protein
MARKGASRIAENSNANKKKFLAFIIAACAVLWALHSLHSFLWPGGEARVADMNRLYICAETGQTFHYSLKLGDTIPVMSPYTGRNTGYPAELCYWTKDGGTSTDPTPVLLNGYKGLPGPTFCPVCGRLVVGHNPAPGPGVKPPPTEAEYRARLAKREELLTDQRDR